MLQTQAPQLNTHKYLSPVQIKHTKMSSWVLIISVIKYHNQIYLM